MGSKYTSQAASGYDASPPSDDGTASEANRVTWAKIKSKLTTVLKTFIEAVNTQLVTTLDTSPRSVAASTSAASTDHWKTIQVTTASVTITLASAASMTAGYMVDVANQSTGSITVACGAGDTIDTITNTTQTISAGETRRYIVNTGASGYITSARGFNHSSIVNTLVADVNLNNTSNYFDGPTVAQGTVGVWLVTGQVVVEDTAGSADFDAKLHDGTTIKASAQVNVSAGANVPRQIVLSGIFTNPAGNIRISVKDRTSTSGLIRFNKSGNSADATISAVRIA